jgi:2-deoxy-D-gluconate 3-dehydrogenase
VAIVTGASRGLGRAMALALAQAGADVAVAARARPDLDETARLVTAAGRRALVVETDVTAYPQVETLVRRTIAELGGLHVVVNNSGIARVAPVAQMSPEDFRATLEVNLVGVFNGCRAAAAHLLAQKSGKIINLSSVLGQVGLPGYSAYAASKSGVMGFTRALAAEWARHGIQVNAIAPGWFVTEMNADAFADERTRDRLLRDVPQRRTGRLDEIGPLAVYLASAASDFMTGQTLFLDGGYSAV